MTQDKTRLKMLTAVIAILTIMVGFLGFHTLRANQHIARLVAQQDEGGGGAKEEQLGDFRVIDPDEEQRPSWPLFRTPFDPGNWEPFSEMDEIHRQMDAMFNDAFGRFGQTPRLGELFEDSTFTPRMDLVDEGDRYAVRLDVPGTEEANIDVTVKDQVLTVETTSKHEADGTQNNQALRRERRIGRFHRQIRLPEPVDAASMETEYEDGVLTITISKLP